MDDTRTLSCKDCKQEITVIRGMAADKYELCDGCYWQRVAKGSRELGGGRAMESTKPEHFTLYDYARQAWVKQGRYVECGHEGSCRCYGREHVGELAVVHTTANCRNRNHGVHVEADW